VKIAPRWPRSRNFTTEPACHHVGMSSRVCNMSLQYAKETDGGFTRATACCARHKALWARQEKHHK
jgi:hypothetical protein